MLNIYLKKDLLTRHRQTLTQTDMAHCQQESLATHTLTLTVTPSHTHIWSCISSRESDKTTAEMKTHIVTVGGWRRADRVRACGADIFLYPSLMWGWWICEKGCSTSTASAPSITAVRGWRRDLTQTQDWNTKCKQSSVYKNIIERTDQRYFY